MPRPAVKDHERISFRIPSEGKAMLLRAAALKHTGLAAFVRQHSLLAAEAVIREEEHVQLSERDSLRVLELLENPPVPGDALVLAVKHLPEPK